MRNDLLDNIENLLWKNDPEGLTYDKEIDLITDIKAMSALDGFVQLHERIEIHNYVDHYEAQLYTGDYEGRLVAKGKGQSVLEALSELDLQLESETLDSIRKLPRLK